jgi:hypothetical protein
VSLQHFFDGVVRRLWKWLNRRSQRPSYTWPGFKALLIHFKLELAKCSSATRGFRRSAWVTAALWLLGAMASVDSSHPLRFQPLCALACLEALDPCSHVLVSRVERDAELVEHSDAWRKADVR